MISGGEAYTLCLAQSLCFGLSDFQVPLFLRYCMVFTPKCPNCNQYHSSVLNLGYSTLLFVFLLIGYNVCPFCSVTHVKIKINIVSIISIRVPIQNKVLDFLGRQPIYFFKGNPSDSEDLGMVQEAWGFTRLDRWAF